MRRLLLGFVMMIVSVAAIAQTTATGNETGFMRSEGKIYVVMVIAITILFGLVIYLIRLDRKISRLEKGKLD